MFKRGKFMKIVWILFFLSKISFSAPITAINANILPNVKLNRVLNIARPRTVTELSKVREEIKNYRKEILVIPHVLKPATPPSGSFVNGVSETKVLPLSEDLPINDCEIVKSGYAKAGEILVEIVDLEEKIEELADKAELLAANPQTPVEDINALLDESGNLIDQFTVFSEELKNVYPPSYSELDRIIEYRWNLKASQINYPDNDKWYLVEDIELDSLKVPGYDWNKSMGESLTESMRLPSSPEATEKRVVVFRRFAAPSEACLSDFNVEFKGTIKVREPIGGEPTRPLPSVILPRPINRLLPITRPIPTVIRPLPQRFNEKEFDVTFNSNQPLPVIQMRTQYVQRLNIATVKLAPQLMMTPVVRPLPQVVLNNSIRLNPVIRNPHILKPITMRPIPYTRINRL